MNPTEKKGDYTLIVPLDRNKTNHATFQLKEMTEEVYLAVRTMLDAKKDLDATRFIVKSLHVGGDNPDILKTNFVATQSASYSLAEFMEPVAGELKKKLELYEIPVNRDGNGDIILNNVFEEGGLGQIKSLVRFYFHVEPKTIEELARAWGELKFALQFEGKLKIKEIKKG